MTEVSASSARPEVEETADDYRERMAALKVEQDAKVRRKQEDRGVIIVNTGDGKGKSTAGFGTALRAAGHGQRVAVFQFIKGTWKTGEREAFKRFPEIDYYQSGNGFTWNTQDRAKDVAAAREGWDQVLNALAQCDSPEPRYSLLVLDELNVVLQYEFLPTEEVVRALVNKPRELSIIITGRGAPQALLDVADTVTEMKLHKHAFEAGVRARRGVEF